jgi:hypothetical protein
MECSDYCRLYRRYRLSALRTNGVEELVDIDLGLFPCPTDTRVRLFLELANDGGLQLTITAPGAVIGIPADRSGGPYRGRLQLDGGTRPGSSWSLLLNLSRVPKSFLCSRPSPSCAGGIDLYRAFRDSGQGEGLSVAPSKEGTHELYRLSTFGRLPTFRTGFF